MSLFQSSVNHMIFYNIWIEKFVELTLIYKTQICRATKNNLNTESTRFVADPLTIGKKFENPHLPDSAPEGQWAHSPGHRPGEIRGGDNALKGQKHLFLLGLLPLQGEYTNYFVHRALPYAMCRSCPFRAHVCMMQIILDKNKKIEKIAQIGNLRSLLSFAKNYCQLKATCC